MSRARRLTLACAAAVLVGSCVYVASGGLPRTTSDVCGIPDAVDGGRTSTASEAPGGGGIRVVEQGFSPPAADGSVSIGAVLENTSDRVAYRTRVNFWLLDSTGHALSEAVPNASRLVVEIPIMPPGSRIGTGTTAHPRPETNQATAAEILPETTTWTPSDALGDFTPVSAINPHTTRPDPRSPTTVDIHYREQSQNCLALVNRGAAVVFRNDQGTIVGGALRTPGGLIEFRDVRGQVVGGEATPPTTPSCSPGDREMWVVPLAPAPATADDANTEIYPYCDLARSPYTGKPGEPVN